MGAWRLAAVIAAALAGAFGSAEVLLWWRGGHAPARPAAPVAVAPTPSAPPPQRPAAVPRPPEAPPRQPAPPPLAAMPRVVTPDGVDAEAGAGALLTGPVRVADGDSLELGRMRIRLNGIDAPELFQTCRDQLGMSIDCGRQARAALEALTRAGPVACLPLGTDRYDRVLALCSNGRGDDINRTMVRQGWALAYEGDASFVAEEREAASARRGIHAWQFLRPAEYRRAHPR